MNKKFHLAWEYRKVLRQGDEVSVISFKTQKPMTGRWTFIAHVITEAGEQWIDVRQESREIIRSFPVHLVEPKLR